MTKRAIWGNIQFWGGSIGLSTAHEGHYRSQELNIPPYCPILRNAILDLLYEWLADKKLRGEKEKEKLQSDWSVGGVISRRIAHPVSAARRVNNNSNH